MTVDISNEPTLDGESAIVASPLFYVEKHASIFHGTFLRRRKCG
jgi:hypothetical protein